MKPPIFCRQDCMSHWSDILTFAKLVSEAKPRKPALCSVQCTCNCTNTCRGLCVKTLRVLAVLESRPSLGASKRKHCTLGLEHPGNYLGLGVKEGTETHKKGDAHTHRDTQRHTHTHASSIHWPVGGMCVCVCVVIILYCCL